MYYKQCVLEKSSAADKEFALRLWTQSQVAWIPESLAHVGKWVKLRSGDNTWDEGWKVVSVGSQMHEDYVLEHERDYKKQAQASDAVRDSNGRWKKVGEDNAK